MDTTHLHLMVNHFPLAGLIFSLLLLLASWLFKSKDLMRAGLVGIFLTGLVTIPTFFTGESAEEAMEQLPGISEQLIKNHEEAAEKAIWLIGATALTAIFIFLIQIKKKATSKWLITLLVILSVLSVAVLAWTNNLGGQISHPEIRKNK